MKKKTLTACLMIVMMSPPRAGKAVVSVGYSPERTCFSVTYRGETSPYKITPLFVLPGENVRVEIASDDAAAQVQIDGWKSVSPRAWTWTAPRKTGFYPARAVETMSGEAMDLQVFVMMPYGKMKAGRLNGYKIGKYPQVPASRQELYSLPRGFVEVTASNKNVSVSPHFKLGQFLCKQQGAYPKYIVLRERLPLKLEHLLEHVNAEEIPARTFHVMSGYRTPYYNRAIGNVKYSRHVWGDAADVFINNDPNGAGMEDLNADGEINAEDAEVLYRIVDEMEAKTELKDLIGGAGWYRPTPHHGPFVHIDARGKHARWGS